MKIKIVSDGTPAGTKVVDAVTGEVLEGVQIIRWDLKVREPFATAIITLSRIPVELEAKLEGAGVSVVIPDNQESEIARKIVFEELRKFEESMTPKYSRMKE